MAIENSKHEYEPGWDGTGKPGTTPMHSDAVCAVCGAAKNAAVHQ
jgi:hypothetical protein